ncbi:unnamed protein product, partial [Timema podura]|nr:unnamed protein product [Timema podura]
MHHMEIWLRHILEWDPKKRGRNSSNKIVVFDLFDEIFYLKIITVYCAFTYQRLSYEVNDDTNMITLCEWVEKDTGLKANDQEWLRPDGNEVDMTKKSAHYWHPIHPSNKTQ